MEVPEYRTTNCKQPSKKGIIKINLTTEIKNIFMKSLQKEFKDSDNIDL